MISAFKRYNSTETKPVEESEQSTVDSAISSATETVSSISEQAQEAIAEKFDQGSDYAPRAPRPARDIQPNKTIYVGNLLFEATPQDLEKEFGEFGEIVSSKIAQDARGLSKGYVATLPHRRAGNAHPGWLGLD